MATSLEYSLAETCARRPSSSRKHSPGSARAGRAHRARRPGGRACEKQRARRRRNSHSENAASAVTSGSTTGRL